MTEKIVWHFFGGLITILQMFFGFIIGTLLGSFMNSLSERLITQRPLLTVRSRCSQCESTISWKDLIPVVSFFVLRGRCRECGVGIPILFPVTELAMGFLAATVIGLFSFSLHGVLWIGFFCCLLVTVQTDYRSGFVYNEALYPLLVFAGALTFIEADIVLRFARAMMWLGMVLAVAWGVKKVLQKEAMGEGDFYVIFALALVARYQEMLEVILGASLLGIIVAWKFKQRSLPFIPLLGTAFSLVFFLRIFA